MNSRETVFRTLNFNKPSRIPRQCWLLPWAEKRYPAESARLATEYPDDIIPVAGMYSVPQKILGDKYGKGIYMDQWGCIFNNIHEGLMGVPSDPIVKTWSDLDGLATPGSMLAVDVQQVNAFCRQKERFTYSNSWIRPFERYQFIRTTELTMLDIALDPPEMKMLIDRIHDHYLKETEVWAKTDIDAIGIMDDWGMQNGMMVSPEYFRKYFQVVAIDSRAHGKSIDTTNQPLTYEQMANRDSCSRSTGRLRLLVRCCTGNRHTSRYREPGAFYTRPLQSHHG